MEIDYLNSIFSRPAPSSSLGMYRKLACKEGKMIQADVSISHGEWERGIYPYATQSIIVHCATI